MVAGDEESVVFNDRSGETHLLSAIAVSLLQHLKMAGPADGPAISACLAEIWEFESIDEARSTTTTLLNELHALDLILASRP